MDRTFTRIMTGLLVVILIGLALDQGYGDHTVAPRTDEEKREAVERTVSGAAANGVYGTEVVVYATTQLQAIFNESRNYPEKSVSLDDTLLYLVYLLDGSIQFPDKVDFCQRVLPFIRESFQVLDRQVSSPKMAEEQQKLLDRIKRGYDDAEEKFKNDPACQPPPTSDPAQQVST